MRKSHNFQMIELMRANYMSKKTTIVLFLLPILLFIYFFSFFIIFSPPLLRVCGRTRFVQVKLCGACCLVCAVVCVVITVTTTVVHMNRLQTLRECVYNARGRSCTCFTGSSSGIGGGGVANVNGQQQPAGIVPIIDPTHDQGKL
jgi:hypothetical protein